MIHQLTTDTFTETTGRDGLVLVDYWASWCGPCRAFAPIYEAASEKWPQVTFGSVDTEAQPQLAEAAGIRSIPTLAAYRDGEPIGTHVGALPGAALDQLIEQLLS